MSRREARPNSAWASSPSGCTSREQALGHYGNVLYDVDTAQADPVWVKEAGVKAAAWYEEHNDWTNADQSLSAGPGCRSFARQRDAKEH